MIKRRSIEELRRENDSSVHESTSSMEGKTVIGIDPGTNFLGYAVISVKGSKMQCHELGVLELSKIDDPYRKLVNIFQRIGNVIDRFHPTEMALEAPFYGKNVQSMLKLGRAEGVAMASGLARGLDVFEYPPLRIKQSVTGVGRASKEQVAKLLEKMFSRDFSEEKLDATDALAVAVCHVQTAESRLIADSVTPERKKKKRSASWEAFASKNKGRILN